MSIPLDRLYHYIESIAHEVCESNIVIYRFSPHGSKKISDLTQLRPYEWVEWNTAPEMYCNDQEPLEYNQYENGSNLPEYLTNLLKQYQITIPTGYNFKISFSNIYDKSLLLHSEQRSTNVKKYQDNGFIPVYYWSHAVIARDWFRYAEHVTQKKSVRQLFLVYNRAWSGTREYRLGFADRLIMAGLVNHIMMRVSPIDSTLDKHYDLHHFKHPHWRPRNVIEKYFPLCTAESHYSADFDIDDYESTEIEVVLETLFDDLRLHLTEKILRPIAMGQPFILAGTYGSLKYLRSYGFKTFSDCWDESYDMMTDSVDRMNKIVKVIEDITVMPKDKQEKILATARSIAEYNKQHFFSSEFQQLIKNELTNNLTGALNELESTNTSKTFLDYRKLFAQHSTLKKNMLETIPNRSRAQNISVVAKAREYYNKFIGEDRHELTQDPNPQ